MKEWFQNQPLGILNRYSACLQAIREAPLNIRAIFHPNHVLNSDRLKTGAQRAERLLGRIV
jgi:hypothetical protein